MSQGHFSAPRGQSSEEGTGARPDTSSQKEGTVGLAFLITNSYTGANFLRGPAKDHDRWLRALEALHFDVRWEKNLTANRMKSFMEEIKKIRNFGTCNYVIFVFSGHGNATSFLGHDGKSVQGCELLSPLFKDNFQDVKKLLFLDACRTKPKGGYNPEDLIPPNSAKYYILYSSPLGGVANDEPEGSQFSKAVTQCIVGDCTIGDICGAALETGYHHAGESWIDTNGNLNQDDRNVKLKDLSRIGGSKDHLPAGAVSGSSSSLPPKAPAVDGGPKDHLPAGAVSGSSSSLPPKAPAVEGGAGMKVQQPPSSLPALLPQATSPKQGHEEILKKVCWIPFGFQAHDVAPSNSTLMLYLVPGIKEIYLEVPGGAVMVPSLEVRTAVIADGPMFFPGTLQLASMVVYVDFKAESVSSSLILHLPDWRRKDGTTGSRRTVIRAEHDYDHSLGGYQFKVLPSLSGMRPESDSIPLSGHCSLYTRALGKHESSSYYLTAYKCDEEEKNTTKVQVVVTFQSDTWLKIFERDGLPRIGKGYKRMAQPHSFEFKKEQNEPFLEVYWEKPQGSDELDWKGIISDPDKRIYRRKVSLQEYRSLPLSPSVSFWTSIGHRLSNPVYQKQRLKNAVENCTYPPTKTCEITFASNFREGRVPESALLLVSGVDNEEELLSFKCPPCQRKGGPPVDRLPERVASVSLSSRPEMTPVVEGCMDAIPSEKELWIHVGKHMHSKWDTFGMLLDVKENVRSSIAIEKNPTSDRFKRLSELWLRRVTDTGELPRTWRTVCETVKDCEYPDLAGKVEKLVLQGQL